MPVPFAYLQSSFEVGHESLRQGCPFLSPEQRIVQLRQYVKDGTFGGGEMLINTLETAESRLDVRRMNDAIIQVANETSSAPWLGLWIPARLPGLWWPSNYSQQPEDWRARGLMSNGSEWIMYPTPRSVGTSILDLHGSMLDIANDATVAQLLTNLTRRFSAVCTPASDCTGPLVGSLLFSEAMLTPGYLGPLLPPYGTHPGAAEFGNISDLQPPDASGRPPLLRMGNASQLYVDNRVVFSRYQGPKRSVPLFSRMARDSFVQFARMRGVHVDALPADRDEFNAEDASVMLPPHVVFVNRSASTVWATWEDWVYHTWLTFIGSIAEAIAGAQRGNRHFGRAYYFQLAGWYSIRRRAHQPVRYPWRDMNGTLRQTTETLVSWPYYADLNPLTGGIDLEELSKQEWLAGFIHEASHGVPIIGVPYPPSALDREERDRWFLASERHRRFVNAQGTMAKEICTKHSKRFGVFARAAYINDPTYPGPSVADTLSPTAFEQAWNYSALLLAPEMIATLSPDRFVPQQPSPQPAPLQNAFSKCFTALKMGHSHC